MSATNFLLELKAGEPLSRAPARLADASAWVRRHLPWLRFRRRRVENSFAEIAVLADGLEKISEALEKKFLETASTLMELAASGGRFVAQSEKLVNMATGRTAGAEVFADALRIIDPPMRFLNDGHQQMQALLERLKLDNERIAGLLRGQDELQRTMSPLKYIQTSFRIESAPLGVEVQTMFSALTQEIEKLHTQVCDLFATKYDELEKIQTTITEVIGRLETQTDEVWKNIAREKVQIDSALGQLQRELADNQKRESSIAGLSGDVSRQIQSVVIGLQFQDIIAQRLQHTTRALAQMQAQFDGSETGLAYLEPACRLEADQLQSVRKDLAGAEKTVKDGVRNIIAKVSDADQKCISLKEFEHLTTSANGMVQVLLDVFGTLRQQIATTVNGCASAYDILRPIGGTASDLTQVVHEFSQRIHLIGLNAQVQAAQVPNGMGLEILSARTSEISRETNRISETMAAQLDRLVAGLNASLQALAQLHAAAGEQQQTLNVSGAGCEKQLHGIRDAALGSLIEVHTLLDGIREQGEQVLGQADYGAVADDALRDLQEKMSAAAALAADCLGDHHVAPANLVAALQLDYTMASERQVFNSAVGGGNKSDAAGEMEFFGEPPPAKKSAVPVAAGGDVELF